MRLYFFRCGVRSPAVPAAPAFAQAGGSTPVMPGGDPVVWVNTGSNVYHAQAVKYYGKRRPENTNVSPRRTSRARTKPKTKAAPPKAPAAKSAARTYAVRRAYLGGSRRPPPFPRRHTPVPLRCRGSSASFPVALVTKHHKRRPARRRQSGRGRGCGSSAGAPARFGLAQVQEAKAGAEPVACSPAAAGSALAGRLRFTRKSKKSGFAGSFGLALT